MNSPIMLVKAICNNDIETVINLLSNNVIDVNMKYGFNKRTFLSLASQLGNSEIVRILLNNGAQNDINIICGENQSGWSPLIFACMRGHVEVVRTLLDNGANPSLKTPDGYTALFFAHNNDHKKIYEMLVYAIYEQEMIQWYKLGLPSLISIPNDENPLQVKSLKQLANESQKRITRIDFSDPTPKQKLQKDLSRIRLKINNQKIDKIHRKIIKSELSVDEINSFDSLNKPSTSNGYVTSPNSPKL